MADKDWPSKPSDCYCGHPKEYHWGGKKDCRIPPPNVPGVSTTCPMSCTHFEPGALEWTMINWVDRGLNALFETPVAHKKATLRDLLDGLIRYADNAEDACRGGFHLDSMRVWAAIKTDLIALRDKHTHPVE